MVVLTDPVVGTLLLIWELNREPSNDATLVLVPPVRPLVITVLMVPSTPRPDLHRTAVSLNQNEASLAVPPRFVEPVC